MDIQGLEYIEISKTFWPLTALSSVQCVTMLDVEFYGCHALLKGFLYIFVSIWNFCFVLFCT